MGENNKKLKIVVCIKPIPTIPDDRDSCPCSLNVYDALAMEIALSLKEATTGSTIIAISMSDYPGKNDERKLFFENEVAPFVDRFILVSDSVLKLSDTLVTSRTLAKAITEIGDVDIIICGKSTRDSSTGHVGPQIAEFLNIPHMTNIDTVEYNDGKLYSTATGDNGVYKTTASVPVVVTVGINANELRKVTLQRFNDSKKVNAEIWDAQKLGLCKKKCGQAGSPTYTHEPFVQIVSVPSERIRGSIDEQAQKIISIIESKIRISSVDAKKNHHEPHCVNQDQTGNARKAIDRRKETADPDKCAHELWIFGESENGEFLPVTFELLGHGSKIATEIKSKTVVVVLDGNIKEDQYKKLFRYGADTVYSIRGILPDAFKDDVYSRAIARLIETYMPEILLIGATTLGRSIAPRISAKMKTGLTADCTGLLIDPETRLLVQVRPTREERRKAYIICPQMRPQMATVRPGVFDAIEHTASLENNLISIDMSFKDLFDVEICEYKNETLSSLNLLTSEIVVGVGLGIKKAENILLFNKLAKLLDAALGATKRVIDEKLLDNKHLIGFSGKTIRPRVYLAFGISGATQHCDGIKNASTIIAINNDADAPIHQIANYSVVEDAIEIVKAMIRLLKSA